MFASNPRRPDRSQSHAMQADPNPLSPIFRQSMLWIPDRQAPSAWIAHVPFAFWLVDVLRPTSIVESGTYNGVSYSAFCQAVKTLSLSTSCFAIDTWKGDEHAGFYDEGVYREFAAFHDQRYAAFSRLVRSTFDEALTHFGDGSIDLLHIDGLHTYKAVRHDFENWFPKLSANAVVLFHDTNVRENNFGVSKFWDELSSAHKDFHFNFLHDHGLGVLGIGLNYRSPLRLVFDANKNRTLAAGVRELFASFGRSTRLLYEQSLLEQEHSKLNVALSDRDAEVAALQKTLSPLDSELHRLRHALTDREAQLSSLQSTLADREAQLSLLQSTLADREAQLSSLQSTQADREAQLSSLKSTLADREAQLSSLNRRWPIRRPSFLRFKRRWPIGRPSFLRFKRRWPIRRPSFLRFKRRWPIRRPSFLRFAQRYLLCMLQARGKHQHHLGWKTTI